MDGSGKPPAIYRYGWRVLDRLLVSLFSYERRTHTHTLLFYGKDIYNRWICVRSICGLREWPFTFQPCTHTSRTHRRTRVRTPSFQPPLPFAFFSNFYILYIFTLAHSPILTTLSLTDPTPTTACRSRDKFKNIRVKVTLKHVTGASKVRAINIHLYINWN